MKQSWRCKYSKWNKVNNIVVSVYGASWSTGNTKGNTM